MTDQLPDEAVLDEASTPDGLLELVAYKTRGLSGSESGPKDRP